MSFSPDFGASQFVTEAIGNEPVVMFALEWCEFCWSVRKFFKQLGVTFFSVDLDSINFQQDDRGVRIREVLRHRLGVATIPQLFVGGRHIGGCSELFEAYQNGSLQRQLTDLGIEFDPDANINTAALLPGWLHPRKSA